MTSYRRVALGDLWINLAISLTICTLIVIGFYVSAPQFHHGFVLPVWICGVIIGVDAINWFRGRLDIFSPSGILGMLGFHFFFIAPLLHVLWDFWMSDPNVPGDWRPWLEQMAWLNLGGLLVYLGSRRLFRRPSKRALRRRTERLWKVHPRNFLLAVLYAMAFTAALQMYIYTQFGGVMGYITAHEMGGEAFAGMGFMFMLSEKFPVIALFGYAFWIKKKDKHVTWPMIFVILIGYLVVALLFGGLRGSRSNTVWAIFWAVGIIHYWIRPFPKTYFYLGILFLVAFMYLYGFYKSGGSEAFLDAVQGAEDIEVVEARTGRSMEGALLGDLGRSDIQAYVLHRLHTSDYRLARGRTYVGMAAILIPASVWPDRPPNKVKEGTEIRFGMGSYVPGVVMSSRVHGLAGETMLNFGPWAVPFAFVVLGFVVGRTERMMKGLYPNDVRWLMVPFLINLSFMVLISDSDNLLFFMVKNGFVPFVVVLMGSSRIRVWKSGAPQAARGT